MVKCCRCYAVPRHTSPPDRICWSCKLPRRTEMRDHTLPASLDLTTLANAYRGGLKPSELFARLHDLAAADSHNAWICLLPKEALLGLARTLDDQDPASLPLYGVPFAVKDNIDLAGLPTTAGCPD